MLSAGKFINALLQPFGICFWHLSDTATKPPSSLSSVARCLSCEVEHAPLGMEGVAMEPSWRML
jgi:hypothetical protein